jgi:hypothetical protein
LGIEGGVLLALILKLLRESVKRTTMLFSFAVPAMVEICKRSGLLPVEMPSELSFLGIQAMS